MSLKPGDVKIIPPIQTTLGSLGGSAVPVYKIYFSIRGEGTYSVVVPVDGFTPAAAEAAINAEAEKICKTLDLYK